MTQTQFQLVILGVVVFVLWKLLGRIRGRWASAMSIMWTVDAFICACVWHVFMFGIAGLLMFVWVQVGGDIALSLPDPMAPAAALSKRK